MAKVEVDYREYFAETTKMLAEGGGLLLAAQPKDGPANMMTIGWGLMGVVWGLPIWTVLVRPSRHTYKCIEEAEAFTVCVPTPALKEAVDFCGTKSGRDFDKFKETGLTFTPSDKTGQPIINECPIVYDCKLVTYNNVIEELIPAGIINRYYKSGDFHRVHFGEIIATYAEEK